MKDEPHEVTIVPIQNITPSKEIVDSSDIIGIIYPTYFLDAPDIVKDFAESLNVQKDTYLFLYANYGGTLGNALYNLDQILGTSQVKAHYEVALPDNSIVFATKKEKIPTMLTDGEKIVDRHANEIYHQKITNKSPKSLILTAVGKGMLSTFKLFLGFDKMKLHAELCTVVVFVVKSVP